MAELLFASVRRVACALGRCLRPGLLAAVLPLAVLSACVSTPEGGAAAATTPEPPVTSASSGRSDLVTASDETDQAKRARIRLELASAYFGQGQAVTALDEVKRALVVDPENVGAYNLRGLIYASLGEVALADESFRRALSIAPADADSLHNYGWFLCRQRRFPEARVRFTAALAVPQYREPSKTLLAQGVCEAAAGDLATAERLLLRSYELDAGNPTTAFNLAEVLLRRGDTDRARFYLQRVNQVPERVNAQTLWLAVRIERKRGNLAAAEEWAQQLRSRFPNARETASYEQGKFDE
ncbi:MAG TPA: type IV pilus biogenesis/stability protein PilW [Burkholderiaceae bacterium]|nr:type IV pilus biogenesis/stability protein PilW [Burkholderiaceae bacterium]